MTNPFLIILVWLLLAAALFLPRFGLLSRWRQGRRLSARARCEDALKFILKCEANGQTPTLEAVAGALHLKRAVAAALLEEMETRGLAAHVEGHLCLLPDGREIALHIIRAHRLWESYLADQTGVAEEDWHQRAERQEHLLSREDTEWIARRLGHPIRDPHGDFIPEAGGNLAADAGQPLTAATPNAPLRIVHIEDEPETVYSQILAQGLRPGMTATVLEKTPQRIRFWADGREHVLAPVLANNVSVVLLPAGEATELFGAQHLADLRPGERGRVIALAPACRGAERRRLLDLGFVPGTEVEVDLVSPLGDPTAYRVRGTLVALRREQAGMIRITTPEAVPA